MKQTYFSLLAKSEIICERFAWSVTKRQYAREVFCWLRAKPERNEGVLGTSNAADNNPLLTVDSEARSLKKEWQKMVSGKSLIGCSLYSQLIQMYNWSTMISVLFDVN